MKKLLVLILVFSCVYLHTMEKNRKLTDSCKLDSDYPVLISSTSSSPMKLLDDPVALKAHYDRIMQKRIISSDSDEPVVNKVDWTGAPIVSYKEDVQPAYYHSRSSDTWDWKPHKPGFKILYTYKQKSRFNKAAEYNYVITSLCRYTKADLRMYGMFNPEEEDR